ncbi:MAG TPA: sigma-70 family RNA polymerase sigma factor [Verrucomicrobiae bacterium]
MKSDPAIETRFLQLVEANRQKILRICQVYAWTSADREDLYQEVLFQIWRALPGLETQAHANTWVYRVALNTVISHVRKTTANKRDSVPMAQDEIRETIEKRQSAVSEQNLQIERLYDAIGKLDKVERALITLFLEDLSYAEIADVLGLNTSHVGVMLHRAKKKLSQLMQQEEVSS